MKILKQRIRYLTSYLRVEASPDIWLCPEGHEDLNGIGNFPIVSNRCSCLLKLLSDLAETDFLSSLIRILMTLRKRVVIACCALLRRMRPIVIYNYEILALRENI